MTIMSLLFSPAAAFAQDTPNPNAVPVVDVEEGMYVPDAEEDVEDAPGLDASREDVMDTASDGEDALPLEIRVSDDNQEFRLPNPEYTIEDVFVFGNDQSSADRIIALMGYSRGSRVSLDALENTRIRLALSGLFDNVDMNLRPGTERGKLILELYVTERPRIQFNHFYLGVTQKSPFWLGMDVSWIAPFNTNHRARLAFAATSADDYTLRLGYVIPTVGELPISLMFGIESMSSHEGLYGSMLPPGTPESDDAERNTGRTAHLDDLRFRRDGADIGLSYAPFPGLHIMFRIEYMALRAEHDVEFPGKGPDRFLKDGHSDLPAASLVVAWDTRNARELPSNGHFVLGSLKGSYKSAISDYSFLRFVIAHQSNFEVAQHHVIRLQTFGGITTPDAPFYEKFLFNDFYSFAPSRIQLLNPCSRGAYDMFGTGASTLGYEDFLINLSVYYAFQNDPRDFEIFGGVGVTWANSFYNRDLAIGIRPSGNRDAFPVDMSLDAGLRFRSPYGIFTITLSRLFDVIAR